MKDVVELIDNSENIAITYHASPDGDALGSALALLRALKKSKKNAYIISKDVISKNFNFLGYEEYIKGDVVEVAKDTQCLITVDCGNVERLSGNFDFSNRSYKIINIDHHLSNDKFGDINYVDTNAAATAEIIFRLIKEMNVELDKDIAMCLYTSLLTDTGVFKHSGTSKNTHYIAGELIDTGIDFTNIHRALFENKPYEKIKLYGKAIESMKLLMDNKVCVINITEKMFKDLGIEGSVDTSDILHFGSEVDTAEVVVLLKEAEEGIKISLRAKNYFDVREVAESFGGGGHTKASGCMIKGLTIKEAEEKILHAISKIGLR
ncbi:bifunctional oligoribonuclease/PAP phosphatase NrnA [Clostridium sp.]|uniref:bifunctional oligoribonuclease/PAP phosphatase NrnA n=1 Tax=Clostridium sp. TaxID=1506 RepID=UPI0034646CF3